METSCATRGKFGTAIGRQRSVEEEPFFGERGSVLRSGRKDHEFPGHHTINLPACLPASLQSTILYTTTCLSKKWETAIARCSFLSHTRPVYVCVVWKYRVYVGQKTTWRAKKIWRVTLEQKELSVEGEISITCLNQECCCKALSIYHLMLQGKNIHSCKYTLTNAIFYGFKQKREFCVCNDEASFSNFLISYSLQAEHGNFGLTSFLW